MIGVECRIIVDLCSIVTIIYSWLMWCEKRKRTSSLKSSNLSYYYFLIEHYILNILTSKLSWYLKSCVNCVYFQVLNKKRVFWEKPILNCYYWKGTSYRVHVMTPKQQLIPFLNGGICLTRLVFSNFSLAKVKFTI